MASIRPQIFLAHAAAVVLAVAAGLGCQSAPVNGRTWVQHQSEVNYQGLGSTEPIASVAMLGATPREWEPLPLDSNPLYAHQQWRSPSHRTGVGVAHLYLPLPLGAAAVVWVVVQRYATAHPDGRLLGQWTDCLGRYWFDATNSKFHICGYALAEGTDAWIVYFGYKRTGGMPTGELNAAARSIETMIPLSDWQSVDEPKMAEGPKAHVAAAE
jgi:hypothetical protein